MDIEGNINMQQMEIARELNLQAMNCLENGESSQAVNLIKSALELVPDSPLLLNNLANAYQYQGDYNHAQDLYIKTINLRPDYPHPYRNLATIYTLAGTHEYAIQAYRHYLALEPDDGEALYNLALLLIEQGYFSEGDECLEYAVIKLKCESEKTCNAIGVAMLLSGDFHKARENLEKALQYDDANASALYNLALLELVESNSEAAKNHLRLIDDNNPQQFLVAQALSAICLCKDEHEKAIEMLRPLEDAGIDMPGIYLNLAYAHQQCKEYTDAEKYFSKAISSSVPGGLYEFKAKSELRKQNIKSADL
ncbi:MAG: tetratricopeptide repeat protein [Gammaproteobacteria bacterium]|nr:tetratricopeptide repeat protein [Gammaproteobacteria bacterium]